jgi:hypothetical protein
MKHLLTLSFCLFFGTFFSQGNLQFNQVITYTGTFQGSLSLGTVPNGKVWKIEARSTDINQIYTFINGFRYDFIYGSSAGLVMNNQPMWLKTGDILSITSQPSCCINRDYFFSILEFNIVP